MKAEGSGLQDGWVDRYVREPPPEQSVVTAETTAPNTPHGLLWLTGIVAVVIGAIAFVLWGINGASILLDMIVALCT